jgi:hypothetical protein
MITTLMHLFMDDGNFVFGFWFLVFFFFGGGKHNNKPNLTLVLEVGMDVV